MVFKIGKKSSERDYSALDQLLIGVDQVVRTLFGEHQNVRPSPAASVKEGQLRLAEKREIAGLMRVNHVGEVCAQALYQGQALTATLPKVRASLERAAEEEVDHLAWCEQRLIELNGRTSYLNPFWYAGSFVIGAFAGWWSDKISLGFVAETERQVTAHLQQHLQRVPFADQKTRAILQQMQIDESQHATLAEQAGAADLPAPVKWSMRMASKMMTTIAYWV